MQPKHAIRAMMMAVASVLLAVAVGCTSVEMSSPGSLAGIEMLGVEGEPDRCVVINNSGCFLFWCLPLASGVPERAKFHRDEDGRDTVTCESAMFEDHAGMDDLYRGLVRIADHYERDPSEVVMIDVSTSRMDASYAGMALALVGSCDDSVSAVLCHRRGKCGSEAAR